MVQSIIIYYYKISKKSFIILDIEKIIEQIKGNLLNLGVILND